ncbi:MAG TPA: hypothetical protein V6C52_00580 [Coleofasciculaceae cyanobacterium]|jgi:hypothetical protein
MITNQFAPTFSGTSKHTKRNINFGQMNFSAFGVDGDHEKTLKQQIIVEDGNGKRLDVTEAHKATYPGEDGQVYLWGFSDGEKTRWIKTLQSDGTIPELNLVS